MAKSKKATKVPTKRTTKSWHYNEVAAHLERLHGKKFRDYSGKFAEGAPDDNDIPYQDFWHWIMDLNEVTNGCYIHLPEWDYYFNNESVEPWKKEIMQYFKDFLGDDYNERLWVEW